MNLFILIGPKITWVSTKDSGKVSSVVRDEPGGHVMPRQLTFVSPVSLLGSERIMLTWLALLSLSRDTMTKSDLGSERFISLISPYRSLSSKSLRAGIHAGQKPGCGS